MLQPKTATVKIEENTYTFNIYPGIKSALISARLIARISGALGTVGASIASRELANAGLSIERIFNDDTFNDLKRFIIDEPNEQVVNLLCNGKRIVDADEHFKAKPLELFILMGGALKENCQDFFTIIGGLLKQKIDFSGTLKSLEEKGVMLPPELLNLLTNFLQTEK